MKICNKGNWVAVCLGDEIGIGTDDENLLFYIRVTGESIDICVAGDDYGSGDYGQLAITPVSSRRLTVRRDRRYRNYG